MIFKTNDGSDGASPTEAMRINSDQRLFFVRDDALAEITMDANRSGANESIGRYRFFWNGTEVAKIEGMAGSDATNKDDGQLRFQTRESGSALAESMRIDSSGNVGIGTSTPARLMELSNTTNPAIRLNNGNSNVDIGVASSAGALLSGAADDDLVIARNGAYGISIGTNGSTRLKIDSSGNVGIGGSPTSRNVEVIDTNPTLAILSDSTSGTGQLLFGDPDDDNIGRIYYGHTDNEMRFYTNASERMRIDGDGNLGIATTANVSATSSEEGLWYQRNDWFAVSRSGGTVAYFNRLSNAGTILEFRKDGVGVGGIINESASTMTVSSNGTGFLGLSGTGEYAWDTAQFYPVNDNANDLGFSSFRWDDVRATNGTIQTSDENDKEQIALLTDAEITAAKAISKLFKTFKWRDKVEAKGDNARTHTGVVAQQVQTAMSDAGLDVTKYAFWCSDTWWTKNVEVAAVEAVNEVVDEDGNVTTEAVEAKDAYIRTDTYHKQEEAPEGSVQKTRLGIRYPELLSFIGAATEQRLTSIESRLTALEGE